MSQLTLRTRPDLQWTRDDSGSETKWIASDPLTLEHFHLRDQEHWLLHALDGTTSLEQLRKLFEQRYAPLRLSASQLNRFLMHLHQLGLIISDVMGQDEVFNKRRTNRLAAKRAAFWSNPLSIALPGIDARQLIDRLYVVSRWLFHPTTLVLGLMFAVIIAGFIVFDLGSARLKAPHWQQLLSPAYALTYFVLLACIKAIHELAHGLTCRHFGGRCREIGVLLLCGIPTLYCDVTDAWRIPSRWQRALIASAGMLVELFIAAVAGLVWWTTQPGDLHVIAFWVMLCCSTSTLFFNLNPLIRSDGYFILSDALNRPNLWQDSRTLCRAWLRRLMLGTSNSARAQDSARMRSFMIWYAIASNVYCYFLVFTILYFAFRYLEPLGLQLLALLLAVFTLSGILVPLAMQAVRFLSNPAERSSLRPVRASLILTVLFLLVLVVLFAPLPHHVSARGWTEPASAKPIYVAVPGTLGDVLTAGTQIEAQQPIATLSNDELELRAAKLNSDIGMLTTQLENYRKLQAEDKSVSPLIPTTEKALADLLNQLKLCNQDVERLTLKAPIAGYIVAPPKVEKDDHSGTHLISWQGNPLEPQNRGAWMEVGQLICYVVPHDAQSVTLLINQYDVVDVRPGQTVALKVQQGPVKTLQGEITAVAHARISDLPPSLMRALQINATSDRDLDPASPHQSSVYYEALVVLSSASDSPPNFAIGSLVSAKITTDWQPLASRIARFIRRNF